MKGPRVSVGTNSLGTHCRAPAVSASPAACLAWDVHSFAVCCPELSFEHSISALELPSLQPTPQHTYMSCMHDLAIINKENHDTTACCGSVPKEPIDSLGADRLAYTDSGPPEPKIFLQYFSQPGSSYRCHPPNTFRSGRERERLGFPENPRGARARRTRRQKDADCGPPPEEHSPDEYAEFRVPAP